MGRGDEGRKGRNIPRLNGNFFFFISFPLNNDRKSKDLVLSL